MRLATPLRFVFPTDVRSNPIATVLFLGITAVVGCAPRSIAVPGYFIVAPESRIEDMDWKQSGSSIVIRRRSTVVEGERLITAAESLHPTRRRMLQVLAGADAGVAERTNEIWDSLPVPAWAHPSSMILFSTGTVRDELLPFSLNTAALSHYVARVHRAAERWPPRPFSDDPTAPLMPANEGAELEYTAQVETATDASVPGARYRVQLRLVYHESRGVINFVKHREVWFGANDEVLAVAGDGLTRRIF